MLDLTESIGTRDGHLYLKALEFLFFCSPRVCLQMVTLQVSLRDRNRHHQVRDLGLLRVSHILGNDHIIFLSELYILGNELNRLFERGLRVLRVLHIYTRQ